MGKLLELEQDPRLALCLSFHRPEISVVGCGEVHMRFGWKYLVNGKMLEDSIIYYYLNYYCYDPWTWTIEGECGREEVGRRDWSEGENGTTVIA